MIVQLMKGAAPVWTWIFKGLHVVTLNAVEPPIQPAGLAKVTAFVRVAHEVGDLFIIIVEHVFVIVSIN